jgi:hypothetical protein
MFDRVLAKIGAEDSAGLKEIYDRLSEKEVLTMEDRLTLDMAALRYSETDAAFMPKEHLQSMYENLLFVKEMGVEQARLDRAAKKTEIAEFINLVVGYAKPGASTKITDLLTYPTLLETLTMNMPDDVRLMVKRKLSTTEAEEISEHIKYTFKEDLNAFEKETRGGDVDVWESRLMDEWPVKDLNGEIQTVKMEFTIENPGGTLDVLKEDVALSRSQARTLYRMWQNLKVREQLERTMGITENTIRELKTRFLTDYDYKLMNYWQKVVEELYPQLNNVTEQLFNKPLGEVPYYISLSRDFILAERLGKKLSGMTIADSEYDAWQLLMPDKRLPSTEVSSQHIKERQLADIPFLIESDYMIMDRYVRRMANYIGFAKPVYYLQTLINEAGGRLSKVYGDKYVHQLNHWADEFAGKAYDNTVGLLQDTANRAMHRVGLVMTATGKQFGTQLGSSSVLFGEVPVLDILSAAQELMTTNTKDNVLLRTILNLSRTKARKNVGMPEWRAYFESVSSGKLKVNRGELMLMNILRTPLGTGDYLAFTFTAYVKAKHLLRTMDMTIPIEERMVNAVRQAIEFANNTNQTADRSGSAVWTHSGNFFNRTAALFQNYGQQMINRTIQTAIDYRHGRIDGATFVKRIIAANILNAALYQIVQDVGVSKDIKRWLYNVFLGTSIGSLPFIKEIVSVGGYGKGGSESPFVSSALKGIKAAIDTGQVAVKIFSGDLDFDDFVDIVRSEGEAIRSAASAIGAVSLQAGLAAHLTGVLMRTSGEMMDTENEYSLGIRARRVLMSILGYSDKALNRSVVGIED